MVALTNHLIIRERTIDHQREAKDAAIEARGRAELVEVEAEHLKGALTKAKADLASKKKKKAVKVGKAKERLAEAERKAEERANKAKEAKKRSAKVRHRVVEAFKESTEFVAEKAQVLEAFKISKEFYDDHIRFNQDAFREGYRIG